MYGIGPHTARRLYNLELRTFQDLEIYYGVNPEEPETGLKEIEKETVEHSWKGRKQVRRDGDLGESWIKVALELRSDLAKK